MVVRPLQSKEVAHLAGVYYRSVHDVLRRDYNLLQLATLAPESLDLKAWHQHLSTGYVCVCECKGIVAGFARVEDDGYIDLLHVDPDWCLQGIGSQLVSHVRAWVAARRRKFLLVDGPRSSKRFFENNAFRVVAARRIERRGVLFECLAFERGVGGRFEATP